MKSMKKKGQHEEGNGLKVSCIFLRISKFLFLDFNQNGKEGNEIDEKKGQHEEGNEIDKKKGHHEAPQSHESVQDREGQARQVFSFSWSQGQDLGGIEEAGSHQKQVGKSRIQKMSDRAKLAFKKNGLAKWNAACQKARKDLKLKGFVPIGGKTSQGKALLSKIRSYYKK